MKKFVLVVLIVCCLTFGLTACGSINLTLEKKSTVTHGTDCYHNCEFSIKNTFDFRPMDNIYYQKYDKDKNELGTRQILSVYGIAYRNLQEEVYKYQKNSLLYFSVSVPDECKIIKFIVVRDKEDFKTYTYRF